MNKIDNVLKHKLNLIQIFNKTIIFLHKSNSNYRADVYDYINYLDPFFKWDNFNEHKKIVKCFYEE